MKTLLLVRVEKTKTWKSMSKSNSMIFDKSKLKCLTCHKSGYFKKDCYKKWTKSDTIEIVVSLNGDCYECIGSLVVMSLDKEKDFGHELTMLLSHVPNERVWILDQKESWVVWLGNSIKIAKLLVLVWLDLNCLITIRSLFSPLWGIFPKLSEIYFL